MDINSPIQRLLLIGQKNIQNSLLTGFLHQRLPIECEMLDAAQDINAETLKANSLICIDGHSLRYEKCNEILEVVHARQAGQRVIIFNIDMNTSYEQLVQWPEMVGFFYKGTSQNHMVKGILAILKGEVWFSRKLLNTFIARFRRAPAQTPPALYNLTKREKQILQLSATGAKNADIADHLNVSTHTVKTHMYNLFKKINVSNRIQAINWAKQHLPSLELDLAE